MYISYSSSNFYPPLLASIDEVCRNQHESEGCKVAIFLSLSSPSTWLYYEEELFLFPLYVYIRMVAWVHTLCDDLQSVIIVSYFGAYIFQSLANRKSFKWAPVSFWHCIFECFLLSSRHVMDFPIPAQESAISPHLYVHTIHIHTHTYITHTFIFICVNYTSSSGWVSHNS